jgi:MoaA/NifB/PqqE/SkfB family radical SAM enzyme
MFAANSGFMTRELFTKIEPFFYTAEWVNLSGFGETLLHRDFFWMLNRVKRAGPRVSIFTNGILMNEEVALRLVEEKLDVITVSIDGATEDTYRRIRGANMNHLIENLRRLYKIKKSYKSYVPHIVLQMVAMKDTVHEVPMLLELADEIGAKEVSIVNMTVHAEHLRDQSLYLHQEIALKYFEEAKRLAQDMGVTLYLPSFADRRGDCTRFFEALSITWDGLVMSCDLDRHVVGDLQNDTLANIWNGSRLRALRRAYFRDGIRAVCPNCFRVDVTAQNHLYPVELDDNRRAVRRDG